MPFANQYSPIGELMTSWAQLSSPPGQYEREDQLTQTFAAGGQLVYQDQLVRIPNGDVTLQLAGRHYYGADDRLMAVQLYSYRSTSLRDGTWEEYWYDALGRRILTRARRDPATVYNATFARTLCMGTIQCRSYTERGWWDCDSTWIRKAIREGKEIVDIGEDALRPGRNKFYQAEKQVIERRKYPLTKPSPPEPKPEFQP